MKLQRETDPPSIGVRITSGADTPIKVQRFHVRPNLPKRLQPLTLLAQNLWWSWNPDAIDLFRRLDPDLWTRTGHNPTQMLGMLTAEKCQALLEDDVFLAHLDHALEELDRYLQRKSWYDGACENRDVADFQVGYFSLEFGLHESVRIYSGGLGVLAGDHLKSASDLGLPLSGVGLLYRRGYFRQYLNHDGWQQETNPTVDVYNFPLAPALNPAGDEVTVAVDLPEGTVQAKVWRLQVGRVPLYLLDTNLETNRIEDRELTAQLYSGGNHMRIRQEILLGIGGVRALRALERPITVFHMNEGHSAFLSLERIENYMREQKMSFAEAYERVAATNVFTTHTPVPAGNDVFSNDEILTYFGDYCGRVGISEEELLSLGDDGKEGGPGFCMTVLALKCAAYRNGVSELHGHVSRDMWQSVWPSISVEEVPISHVTNGIHTESWLSLEMARLFNRYLGPGWLQNEDDRAWRRVREIPDSELWRSHERLRERLVAFGRRRLRDHLQRRGSHRSIVRQANEVLDPEVLTIGFARRFATYKRATLIFRDHERLERILNHPERPVQLIFAGKAHPKDGLGKELIREIVHLARQERFRRRIVFLEDYDINTARYLVHGCDVWLNNPRRPLEASGTSGMKVVANGGLNLSVLDGWWCEGFQGDNGWSIGNGEDYDDHVYQDEVETMALYDVLEKEVVPLFYRRGADGLPRDWIAMMKESIATCCPKFSTDRMVREYSDRFYFTAANRDKRLGADGGSHARERAAKKQELAANWHEVSIADVVMQHETAEAKIGVPISVYAYVHLGPIAVEDVQVELLIGSVGEDGGIHDGRVTPLDHTGDENGIGTFAGTVTCTSTGQQGMTVRVLPRTSIPQQRFDSGLITWWRS